MDLGKKIRKLREQRGYSAKELSELSGVTRSLISELETGKRQSTSVDTIGKLSAALHVSPSYFFGVENLSSLKVNYSVSTDIQEFLLREDSQPYLKTVQRAQELGVVPEILEGFLDLVEQLRVK